MSIGVMIVGLRGATASTLAATAPCASRQDLAENLLSEQPFARPLGLADVSAIRWGGWDVTSETWAETVARHGVLDPVHRPDVLTSLARVIEFPGLALERDHAVCAGETSSSGDDGEALVDRLRRDIRAFRGAAEVEHVILAYLATPALLPTPAHWPATAAEFRAMVAKRRFASAAPYYMAAAIEEGAAIIDYTASATLEMPGLCAFAVERGVPVAGRDGSTGQTLLKSVLAETFATRRLRVRGWYSTNILGNHDGLVLQDPRYCDVKRIDKTALLDPILGYEVSDHLVDIRYYRPAGDNKEAWDAIDFAGWSGSTGQLRINWRASDSCLAAPAILDLCRFLGHSLASGAAGVQAHLGVFFKFPLGTSERRYLHLARALEAYATAAAR